MPNHVEHTSREASKVQGASILPSSTSTSQPSQTTSSTGRLCISLHNSSNIIISKRALIASIAVLVLLTLISMTAVAALLYREYSRRKEAKAAKKWGRKSKYDRRVSRMAKEVDDEYSRQYKGCLVNEAENPEMGDDEPVELMLPERCWEVPAVPAKEAKRKSRVVSLFFDSRVGMWLPKR